MKRVIGVLAFVVVLIAGTWGLCQWWKHRSWSDWEAFAEYFIEDDGRVVDRTAGARSTSEGQVYALFFALVANQPERFETILEWTRDNLAQGDLGENLPAWLWGRLPVAEDEPADTAAQWGVIDDNPASDADLWLAYVLFEAGRLWQLPAYTALAEQVLALIVAQEVVSVDGLGNMLLPAPDGFTPEPGVWRFNASYVPTFQMRYFAGKRADVDWMQMVANVVRMVTDVSPHGLASDWTAYTIDGGFETDRVKGAIGSYDAIRVYLWAAMSGDSRTLQAVAGFSDLLGDDMAPPERVNVVSGQFESGWEPIGFSGALLPYLSELGREKALRVQRQRLDNQRNAGLYGGLPAYYDQVLTLFGKGWLSGRFRFGKAGKLEPVWGCSCWAFISDSR